MPSRVRLAAVAAVAAARLAAAQSYERGQEQINDCRSRLPPDTVFNVLNGTAGVTGVQTLSAGAPGLFTPTSGTVAGPCTGYSLNSLAKHVSGRGSERPGPPCATKRRASEHSTYLSKRTPFRRRCGLSTWAMTLSWAAASGR